MRLLLVAVTAIALSAGHAQARQRSNGPDLPVSCDEVRNVVAQAGGIEAAERLMAQYGFRLSAKQRRQALGCMGR